MGGGMTTPRDRIAQAIDDIHSVLSVDDPVVASYVADAVLAAPITDDGATLADLLALWERYSSTLDGGWFCMDWNVGDQTLLEAVRAAAKDGKP